MQKTREKFQQFCSSRATACIGTSSRQQLLVSCNACNDVMCKVVFVRMPDHPHQHCVITNQFLVLNGLSQSHQIKYRKKTGREFFKSK